MAPTATKVYADSASFLSSKFAGIRWHHDRPLPLVGSAGVHPSGLDSAGNPGTKTAHLGPRRRDVLAAQVGGRQEARVGGWLRTGGRGRGRRHRLQGARAQSNDTVGVVDTSCSVAGDQSLRRSWFSCFYCSAHMSTHTNSD